jgi:hypothetical protein
MIWLLARPLTTSVSLSQASYVSPSSLLTGGEKGVGEEPNHTTAREKA